MTWTTIKDIVNWRLNHGLSLRAAAEVLEVDWKTLHRWEHGLHEPSELLLYRVSQRMREYGK